MLAIAHWPQPGRINLSSPTFRHRYVRRVNGFSFRLLIFAVLDYILTSSLNSGLDTVSLTVLLPFQYPVFHIITLYFYSLLHYVILIFRSHSVLLMVITPCWVLLILLMFMYSFILQYILIFSFIFSCTVSLILLSGVIGSWLVFCISRDLSEDKPGKSRFLRFQFA